MSLPPGTSLGCFHQKVLVAPKAAAVSKILHWTSPQECRGLVPRLHRLLASNSDKSGDEPNKNDNGGSTGSSGRAGPDLLAAGLREAEEVYRQAHRMALQLTRKRLDEQEMHDFCSSQWPGHNAAPDRPTSEPETTGRTSSDTASSVDSRRPNPAQWHEERLVRLLQSKGASRFVGEEIARQLGRDCSPYLDGDLLASKLERLEGILPDVDVIELLAKDASLLDVDLYLAVHNMVALCDHLQGNSVTGVISSCPKLLRCTDLDGQLCRVMQKLESLLPRWKRTMLVNLVSEYPELIFRLHLHLDKSFSELPIDIQNVLAIGGGGGGSLFRSWKKSSLDDQTPGQQST